MFGDDPKWHEYKRSVKSDDTVVAFLTSHIGMWVFSGQISDSGSDVLELLEMYLYCSLYEIDHKFLKFVWSVCSVSFRTDYGGETHNSECTMLYEEISWDVTVNYINIPQ
jgi:hypothetical protein